MTHDEIKKEAESFFKQHPGDKPEGYMAFCIWNYELGYGYACYEYKGLTHFTHKPTPPTHYMPLPPEAK